ncbi:MAG: NAD(P)H-dependent oxidoreductase [Deltaproteobacteria bacterium]|nr:NAD(P)H-dependent oxidoreductase [Deltaproteobacteria bacterium]
MVATAVKTSVLALSGSLRKASYNTALLRAARELAPEGMTVEIYTLERIPPFNLDLENDMPPAVLELKEKIREADGLLFGTPEHNYSIPGVLKNAIDWASRPPVKVPFLRKPAAIIGASTGQMGTARSQYHLRQVLVCLDMFVMNRPEIFVGMAEGKFDAEGSLSDEETRGRLAKMLAAFAGWIAFHSRA